MPNALLATKGLTIAADDVPLLHDIDLTIESGTTHVLMGPNGAGKSTLGHALMGDPEYTATAGSIVFDGQDITEFSPDKRSTAGLFMSFQAPVEVPGVPLFTFLRAIVAQRPDLKLRGPKLKKRILEIMAQLDMDPSYLDRELNVGFSGGEKKKVEMLQLLLLQPKLAILDETDSGLDVDAVRLASEGIHVYQQENPDSSLLIITHSTKILESLHVDYTHVMVNGHIIAIGDASLIEQINREGYEQFKEQM